jgi:hypothetical protein
MEQLFHENSYITQAKESSFSSLYTLLNEVVMRNATGQFYKQILENEDFDFQRIGSSYFNYDKKSEKLKYDERESEDEQVPMLYFMLLFTILPGGTHCFPVMCCPFIGEVRNLNTGIKKDEKISKEKEDKNNVMFCFSVGIQDMGDVSTTLGSPFCYDARGVRWGNLSLQYSGNEGIFVRFWKQYDSLLRHALRKITCKLNIPLEQLLKFSALTPKLINGTKVIPVRFKYSIGNKGTITVEEAEFKTLQLQQPYDINNEQEIPQFNGSAYYWVQRHNMAEVMAAHHEVDNNSLRWGVMDFPPSVYNYPPPTQEQVDAGGKYYEKQYDMRIVWWTGGLHSIVQYSAWLEPRKK